MNPHQKNKIDITVRSYPKKPHPRAPFFALYLNTKRNPKLTLSPPSPKNSPSPRRNSGSSVCTASSHPSRITLPSTSRSASTLTAATTPSPRPARPTRSTLAPSAPSTPSPRTSPTSRRPSTAPAPAASSPTCRPPAAASSSRHRGVPSKRAAFCTARRAPTTTTPPATTSRRTRSLPRPLVTRPPLLLRLRLAERPKKFPSAGRGSAFNGLLFLIAVI